jgi:hypothetical protein
LVDGGPAEAVGAFDTRTVHTADRLLGDTDRTGTDEAAVVDHPLPGGRTATT